MKQHLHAIFALGLVLTAPAVAHAESASASLAAAERAYQEVDFPSTRDAARRALEAGGANPRETARLHVLLGISAAALGDADEAKQEFVAALAVDPSFKLDKGLSPKIRDPYLQAQGYWSAAGDRLALRASPTGDGEHLLVHLQDAAALVAKLALDLSAAGTDERHSFALPPSPEARFDVPLALRAHDYGYVLRALDRYGNVLTELGSEADPQWVRRSGSATSQAPQARGRSYLLPIALGITGLGAIAAGVVFNVNREQAAHTWNGPSCEQPGATRLQQCASVNDRIQADERLSVGFYAGGGALIAGSIISLLAGRPAAEAPQRARSLACAVAGPGVSCAGTF